MPEILVDQEVAKKYFEKEVDFFLRFSHEVKSRGWKVHKVDFPFFEISLYTTKTNVKFKYFTLKFDLTNYNAIPISIEVVYPKSYVNVNGIVIGDKDRRARVVKFRDGKNVLLVNYKTKRPFICMKGTFEYHTHRQHEKTYWDVFKYSKQGKLFYIVNSIWEGSTNRIVDFKGKVALSSKRIIPYKDPILI